MLAHLLHCAYQDSHSSEGRNAQAGRAYMYRYQQTDGQLELVRFVQAVVTVRRVMHRSSAAICQGQTAAGSHRVVLAHGVSARRIRDAVDHSFAIRSCLRICTKRLVAASAMVAVASGRGCSYASDVRSLAEKRHRDPYLGHAVCAFLMTMKDSSLRILHGSRLARIISRPRRAAAGKKHRLTYIASGY